MDRGSIITKVEVLLLLVVWTVSRVCITAVVS